MAAKALEVAGPGAAGVDRRRDAARSAELLGVDAERGAAPVDMGVQVDEARRHDVAGDVAHISALTRQPVAERRHPAIAEGDVGDPVGARMPGR